MKNQASIKNRAKLLIEKKRWDKLRGLLEQIRTPDIAEILPELDKKERVIVFRTLPKNLAAEVFAELSPEDEKSLIEELTDEETRRLLADIDPDDRTELFEELPGRATQRLLNLLTPEDLKEARFLLGYPEESVGRLMTPDYMAIRPDWTVERAIEHIRKRARRSETVNTIYVTDDEWRLVGVCSMRDLIVAKPKDSVEKIMSSSVVTMSATADQEEAVRVIAHYNFTALPVVDSAGVMLGIITVDDLMDVAEKETTEDFQKTAGVRSFNVDMGKAGIKLLYGKRIGWLTLLIFINLIAGGIIVYFEDVIAQAVVLVAFLPLIIDSAGNAGSQSATLTIRALATGEAKVKDWFRFLSREVAIGAALGATMGALVWVLGIFRAGPEVAMVAALTMAIVVLVGSVVGISMPFVLNVLKMDPATASAPLITSIADVTGVLIYFFVASKLLGF